MIGKGTEGVPPLLFYSYSHEDEAHLRKLQQHLAILRRQGRIRDWHDRKLVPGQPWETALDGKFEEARIILLLISPSFIHSDYCWGREMTRAIQRHEAREAVVIPIIVRPSADWTTTPFGSLQALPRDGRPVTTWGNRDQAWANVASGIRMVVDHL